MTRNTTVHGYTVPTEGDTDYEDTFDVLFDKLDEDIVYRDSATNRPSDPPSGTIFLDETNNVIEEYDGNNWNIRAGLGSSSKPLPDTTIDTITLADALTLEPTSPPSSPSSGYTLYVDTNDGSLKAKDSAGNVSTIVS